MSLELQYRLERLDPKHASIWKRVFATPAVCLFDRKHSNKEEEYAKNGQALYYQHRRMIVNWATRDQQSKQYVMHACPFGNTPNTRLITALYLPVESSLCCVDLMLNNTLVAKWTPDQPERGISLETILSYARDLPHGRQYYGPTPSYRPSPNLQINGRIYRRVVLFYPGINDRWLNATFSFTMDKCETTDFYQEELVPATDFYQEELVPATSSWKGRYYERAEPKGFSPFPPPEMPKSTRALLVRSETPKQLLASSQWAVPALSTGSPSLSLITST